MNKLHLIMPMGGAGTRFLNNGYECPKPLIALQGKPFFYWAVMSVWGRLPFDSLRFVVLREHMERFQIHSRILEYFPQAVIEALDQVLPGAVLTCLQGTAAIPEEDSLLFNDCDHWFSSRRLEAALKMPVQERPDGILSTFPSREPKFSFLAYDEKGNVTRTVEKQVISNDAICGAYYFNTKKQFVSAAETYLDRCSYSEFFMSGVYNELISAGGVVRGLEVDRHISFGTPEEYAAAEKGLRLEELLG